MLGVCLVLGFVGGVAALVGLVLAGSPIWLAVLGYSLAGSIATGASVAAGHWFMLPPRKRPAGAARPVRAMSLQPVRR